MRIAVFGNTYKTEIFPQVEILLSVFKKHNVSIIMDAEFYEFIFENLAITPDVEDLINHDKFQADLAVSMGGDGTFLSTAARIGNKNIPIVGINTGRLGFLADIADDEIESTFEKIFNNEYLIEERSLLQLNCGNCCHFSSHNIALNEIAILKQDTSSMITIHTYINDEHLISYQSDGLIIATPTGSTAYSMSVGGPLLVPNAKNLILTPIASHSLTVRPLIITDDCEIRLKVEGRAKTFLTAVDGRSEIFEQGSTLVIKKADFNIRILKQKEHDFFNTLRNKLMWGADARTT